MAATKRRYQCPGPLHSKYVVSSSTLGMGTSADRHAAMALVTYTLLSALSSGLQSRFHPEILGVSFSKALAVVITEFCIIKLGCYLLDVRGGGASGVELIGYGGYKFVG